MAETPDEVLVSQIHVLQYLTGRDRPEFGQESIRNANEPRKQMSGGTHTEGKGYLPDIGQQPKQLGK